MITTKHDFEVIWRIKLSDGFFYYLKTDIVEDKYLKIVGGVEDIFQFKEKDNRLTKRAKVDCFYSFVLPNPSIKARQFHQYNVAKSINTD